MARVRALLLLLLLVVGARARHRKSARVRLHLHPAAPGTPLAARARNDRHRHAYISSKPSSMPLRLSSAAYTSTGEYLVRLRLGTPARPFLLVADTASDLTWVKCRRSTPTSTSWSPLPCSAATCVPDIANCSSSLSLCSYHYRYLDGSWASGVLGTDSKLPGVVLGCTTSYHGGAFQALDGVLGLGNSDVSFASAAAARFGGRFSYCLVDHLAPRNAIGYLTFGPATPEPAPDSSSSTTPLLLGGRMSTFYGVSVAAISVAGEALDIPSEVWDAEREGGAILDSGTTLTILAAPAYRAVVAALRKHLVGLPRVAMDPFEYCYNWTAAAPAIPSLAVHFAGPARLEPPAKSYVVDAADGVKCIGLQEGDWPGVSIIGNILQQEHLWEFDLRRRLLRFRQTSCTQ